MAKFAMASGRLIDVSNFTEDDVCLDDIAHHLAKIQRFNGGSPLDKSYTVGEHCINLVQHAMRVGGFSTLALRMLLLHDASEAYLSDIVSPVKPHIPNYLEIENKLQLTINRKFLGINKQISDSARLHELDKSIVIDEVEHIKPEFLGLYARENGRAKLGCHIHYNNHPATTKTCFLTLAKYLGIYERGYQWNE